MKKNIFKILATAFAVALIVASPATTITSHAMGFNPGAHDDTDYGTMPEDYWGDKSESSNSSSSDSSSSNSSSSESSNPAPAPRVEDNSSSNSGGSMYGDGFGFNADAHDDTDYGTMPGDYYTSNTSTAISNSAIVSVPGSQKFCSSMSSDHTAYQVYHMGISRASFAVEDEEGNAVKFENVKLEKGTDGLWYENITLAKDVDTEGLTVNVTKGDASYLTTTLGVSGIKLNGEVVELVDSTIDAK